MFASCNDEKAEGNATEAEPAHDSISAVPAKEKELLDAVHQHPDSSVLKETLIQYYEDNADYEKALKELNAWIAKDSLSDRLFDKRATIHFKDEDTVSAITDFEHAIRIKAKPEYVIALGTLYAQTKNEQALLIADELINSKADADKEGYFIKGLYYTFTNEKVKAIAWFDKCLSISYTFMDAYIEKSIALYDLGKYQEALDVLDKALTLQNTFDEAYYYSGKCLEKMKRIPEAIQSYQNALLINPDYVEARDALGKLGVKG